MKTITESVLALTELITRKNIEKKCIEYTWVVLFRKTKIARIDDEIKRLHEMRLAFHNVTTVLKSGSLLFETSTIEFAEHDEILALCFYLTKRNLVADKWRWEYEFGLSPSSNL